MNLEIKDKENMRNMRNEPKNAMAIRANIFVQILKKRSKQNRFYFVLYNLYIILKKRNQNTVLKCCPRIVVPVLKTKQKQITNNNNKKQKKQKVRKLK